ncbi:hypothetical protein O1611_g2177 [Lasiodiplodia mahajangana]|uniref:Uncharacterized protein n=1 Tax=Lasiodiplodia mahajangana TaxID=1108764 RepID=A0ACC2JV99_9PEZI|nr:hypothetical protein O1611_g2177 [Lasiodiplodia mahajangana]
MSRSPRATLTDDASLQTEDQTQYESAHHEPIHGRVCASAEHELGLSHSEDDESVIEERSSKTALMQMEVLRSFQTGVLKLESQARIDLFEEKYKHCLTGGQGGDTLVHLVLRESGGDVPFTFHRLLEVCLQLIPTILEERNKFGETPLHIAIERRAGEYLKWLVSKTSRPAQAIACTGPNGGNCLHAAIRRRVSHIRYLIEMCDASSIMALDDSYFTPLHYAVDARFCTSQQLEVVKDLLIKCPKAVLVPEKTKHSVYQVSKRSWDRYNKNLEKLQADEEQNTFRALNERLKTRLLASPSTEKRRKKIERNAKEIGPQIQQFLKTFIIREYDLDTCLKVLYDEGKEQDLVFDLTEFEGLSPENVLARLENLKPFMHFEDTIASVTIPKLSGGENGVLGREDFSAVPPTDKSQINIASKAVIAAFNLLRECGVKKIVRVIVEDRGDPPYDDDTIEAALSGFDIEDWDWQTRDICVETINQIAPNARGLKLYPSGNNGVLRSWSAADGLIRLSQLREVILVVGKSVQSRERTFRNIAGFRARLEKESQGRIRVIIKDTVTEPVLTTNPDKEHRREFLESLRDIVIKSERIPGLKDTKIALIEDGVDAANKKIGVNISRGRSFVYLADGRIAPWWTSSSGRGTTMAEILGELAGPMELYVARVSMDPNSRVALVPSALQAIRWAVSQGVDIICFKSFAGILGEANVDFRALNSALKDLVDNDILFMTIPRPPESKAKSKAPNPTPNADDTLRDAGALYIAATNSEERVANFLFPGQYATPAVPSGAGPDADSVSLALAISLAAQILSLTRGIPHEGKENALKDESYGKGRVETVKSAFGRLRDNTGNVLLDGHASWLHSIIDAAAAAAAAADVMKTPTIGYGSLSS